MNLEVGDLVDSRYRITQVVETGSGVDTFTAQHEHLGRTVALRILRSDDKANTRAFKRAGRILGIMRHPSIAQVYDLVKWENHWVVIMEYLGGQTIEDRIRSRGSLPFEEAVTYSRALLDTLKFLHSREVVHRDISLRHLVACETHDGCETLKLRSFSFARELRHSRSSTGDSDSPLAARLTHLPPEQIRDPASKDVRVDIYSAGACLYHLFSGRSPFPFNTLAELGHAIMNTPPAPIDNVCHELNAVILKALEKDPGRRFQTSQEMIEAFELVIDVERSAVYERSVTA